MTDESTVQIIPYYSHPHVFTVINDNSYYDETVADTSTTTAELPYSTAIVVGADQGIDNKFVRLKDLATKKSIFGESNYMKYGQPSLQLDALFNGNTNVWVCRVLPDNATYGNLVILAHYRKGKILDELNQETGKSRLEIKFSVAYATTPYLTSGAVSDDAISEFAKSLAKDTADAQTGYMTIPIGYVRMTGRGKYGNNYSISITRDTSAEKEYSVKMYDFNLISNTNSSKITNIFAGSLVSTIKNSASLLINDVTNSYSDGSSPIIINMFDDSIDSLYDFYKDIVAENLKYIQASGGTSDELAELKVAQAIENDTFDPIFGYVINTKKDEIIPYYRNYTVKSTGAYTAPTLMVPSDSGATKPLNISDWNTAYVGATVVVTADPLNDGLRWKYTVMSIDTETGNIVYDEGVEVQIDDDQYDGVNLAQDIGQSLSGGSDGDFQQITVNGTTRAPSDAELKLLLSREYVKAWRGEKDRRILSPSRIDLDFIFDANYNLSEDESVETDDVSSSLYSSSTVLTDKDAQSLSVVGSSLVLDYTDLNVKGAMYDLNEFRNKNGMEIDPNTGAGCILHLDCNLTGLNLSTVNDDLKSIINMMSDFTGRQTSVDLGYYYIYDPSTRKKIPVTATYKIAKDLVPHIMQYGINKPYVFNYAQLKAIQRSGEYTYSGEMIRDTFAPDIDLIDWDVKETLYKSRINYWLTTDEGRTVQRACQNTRQTDASALLEENNVRVLNTLKKNLERAQQGYLFEWSDPTVRKSYTQAQMDVYRPWIGTIVEDINIVFKANEFEEERMMMHCYVDVKFRNIAKRIICEININKTEYSGGEE
jgi:hypothetical protein